MDWLWWVVTILWATVTGIGGVCIGFGIGRIKGEDAIVTYVHDCTKRGHLKWGETMYRLTRMENQDK
jgi:hypothetical protein